MSQDVRPIQGAATTHRGPPPRLPVGAALAALPQAAAARRIVAIGGGKGGIGKSLISSNLGVHLAASGRRVVLLDADLGGANLHTCLGMAAPRRTLSDFVSRQVHELDEVVTPTGHPNLGLISGALDVLSAANPKYTEKARLLREIGRLDVDVVIIDLGGGTGFNILDFFLLADRGVLTIVPEPTSIENAYRFIKAACFRHLKNVEAARGLPPLLDAALAEGRGRGLKSPTDLLAAVAAHDPEVADVLGAALARMTLYLTVNQVRSAEEAQLGGSVVEACRKYFGITIQLLGSVSYDDAVWQAVRRRRPVVLDSPGATASGQLRDIAAALELER